MDSYEFDFHQNVGSRKISVLVYDNYEFKRDRGTERLKMDQLWVCRWARKFKCKSKLRLLVQDLEDIRTGSTITLLEDHNHAPYCPDNYGIIDVITIQEEMNLGTPEESASDHFSDLSRDFEAEVVSGVVQSSPIPKPLRMLRLSQGDEDQGVETIDITSILVDTSKTDTRGMVFRRFVEVPRNSTAAKQFNEEQPAMLEQALAFQPAQGESSSDEEDYQDPLLEEDYQNPQLETDLGSSS